VGSLRVVVDIGSGSPVCVVRESLEGSGGGGASDSACIHFPEYHSGGLDQTERGVNGEEFAGGTGFETVCVIHAETICTPV
jgi:hypothetical protein